jgi:LAO/AO transport system kinase
VDGSSSADPQAGPGAQPAPPPAALAPTSLRIGISGPPGVGKSTLIEAWGSFMAEHGHKVRSARFDRH